MPTYEYEHDEKSCDLGVVFEVEQSIKDEKLTHCPKCGRGIHKLISLPFIAITRGDSYLKSMGFTKLVRRDNGIYENVTATDKESRYFDASKPETMPDIKKRIKD